MEPGVLRVSVEVDVFRTKSRKARSARGNDAHTLGTRDDCATVWRRRYIFSQQLTTRATTPARPEVAVADAGTSLPLCRVLDPATRRRRWRSAKP
ncbi:hypothetical protein MRX96_013157 [Rhipicephalus microplus]